jgi:hypothetical protein
MADKNMARSRALADAQANAGRHFACTDARSAGEAVGARVHIPTPPPPADPVELAGQRQWVAVSGEQPVRASTHGGLPPMDGQVDCTDHVQMAWVLRKSGPRPILLDRPGCGAD